MTLTLTDHCSMTVEPFHKGSKEDKDNLRFCFITFGCAMWNFLYEWLIKSVFLLFVKNIYTKIFNNFN